MTRLFTAIALSVTIAAPVLAGDAKEPAKGGVIVWDEANEIFMDKRSPEEREADIRTRDSITMTGGGSDI